MASLRGSPYRGLPVRPPGRSDSDGSASDGFKPYFRPLGLALDLGSTRSLPLRRPEPSSAHAGSVNGYSAPPIAQRGQQCIVLLSLTTSDRITMAQGSSLTSPSGSNFSPSSTLFNQRTTGSFYSPVSTPQTASTSYSYSGASYSAAPTVPPTPCSPALPMPSWSQTQHQQSSSWAQPRQTTSPRLYALDSAPYKFQAVLAAAQSSSANLHAERQRKQEAAERERRERQAVEEAKARERRAREEEHRRELAVQASRLAQFDRQKQHQRQTATVVPQASSSKRRAVSDDDEDERPRQRPRNKQIASVAGGRSRSSSPAARKLHVVLKDDPAPVASGSGLSAKDRLRKSFDAGAIVPLGTTKRDLRSVDEVERDMKARQGQVARATAKSTSVNDFFRSKPPAAAVKSVSSAPPAAARPSTASAPSARAPTVASRPQPVASSSKAAPAKAAPTPQAANASRPVARAKPKPAAASRPALPPAKRARTEDLAPLDISDQREEIWRLFGKDRATYHARDRFSDEDDDDAADMSDDMDAGFEEIMEEERRAERQAKRDDKREAERLRAHAEAKAKRKAGK